MENMEHRAYELWIQHNVSRDEAFQNCTLWTRVMQRDFPELRRVEGAVKHRYSMHDYHEYLLAPNGEIIDPTRSQFDDLFGTDWEYLPYSEENIHDAHVL